MNPVVQGYAAAISDAARESATPEAPRTLARDVEAIEREVASNLELRTVVTDVALAGRARRAVLADLLQGKTSAAAARLCAYALGAQSATEAPATLSWLVHRLSQLAEGRVDDESVLALRESRQRIGGYATALFEDSSVAELEELEDELFRLARTIASAPALRSTLGDRDLPAGLRAGVVDDLIGGKVREGTRRLVRYAITAGRPRDVVGTLDWLAEQAAAARGWRVARVEAGQQIDANELGKLESSLSQVAGVPVELQVEVDPRLLAGVTIELGDLRIDATARGRLDRLRDHVAGAAWANLAVGHPTEPEGSQAHPMSSTKRDEGGAVPRG